MKFSEQVSQETPANAGFGNQLSQLLLNVPTKRYFLKNISFFVLYSSEKSRLQLFFLNKKFQGGGQRVVAQERIKVGEAVGRKNNCKLNFFSMYFVRNNEEIHLSFKNSEKQRTQALNHSTSQLGGKNYNYIFIFLTIPLYFF